MFTSIIVISKIRFIYINIRFFEKITSMHIVTFVTLWFGVKKTVEIIHNHTYSSFCEIFFFYGF